MQKFFGPGFKNFGTGAKSESENVTTATSVFQKGPQFKTAQGPEIENSPLVTRTVESLRVIGLQARVNVESYEISYFFYDIFML